MIIIYFVAGVSIFLLIAMYVWLKFPFKSLKWLYHDILECHIPNDTYYFQHGALHSGCRICGKEIVKRGRKDWVVY